MEKGDLTRVENASFWPDIWKSFLRDMRAEGVYIIKLSPSFTRIWSVMPVLNAWAILRKLFVTRLEDS
ncbi:MAG: hypothetical protein QW175_06630 [Candidatus Bathyarchaeia archaeon]